MNAGDATAPVLVEAYTVITRACQHCGAKRDPHSPCAGCGLTEPAIVEDLGLTCAAYRDPQRQHWWNTTGKTLAAARTAAANRNAGS